MLPDHLELHGVAVHGYRLGQRELVELPRIGRKNVIRLLRRVSKQKPLLVHADDGRVADDSSSYSAYNPEGPSRHQQYETELFNNKQPDCYFLLEIGLDEVPARMIAGAEAELGRRVNDLLTRERLLADGAKLTTYSTPRRLAVLVEGVLASQADSEEQLTGPSWNIAFKDGAPTKAAEAFAKKAGVEVEFSGKGDERQGRVCRSYCQAPRSRGLRVTGNRVTQGSARPLLGQKYVLARGQAGALCPPHSLDRRAARFGDCSAGDCRDQGWQCEPRPSHSAW